jgi:hypothetical protein
LQRMIPAADPFRAVSESGAVRICCHLHPQSQRIPDSCMGVSERVAYQLPYETTSPGRCIPPGSLPFHQTMPRIYTSLACRSEWMIRLIVRMRLCSAGDRKCSTLSMITASLRRTYRSARLTVAYFALPGCGLAILILDIVWVLNPAQRGCFDPRSSLPGALIKIESFDSLLVKCCDTVAVCCLRCQENHFAFFIFSKSRFHLVY